MPSWSAGSGGAGPSGNAQYKVHEVQNRVDAVKGIMQENVEVMLQNIEKTEVLENKSAELASQAKTFHRTARATKRHMCKQNMKMNIIIAVVCILLLIVILVPVLSHIAPMMGGGGGDPASPSPAPPSPSPSPLPPPPSDS